jgi:hypothetical protein
VLPSQWQSRAAKAADALTANIAAMTNATVTNNMMRFISATSFSSVGERL